MPARTALTHEEREYTRWRFGRAYAAHAARAAFEYSFDEAYAAFAHRAYIPRTAVLVARDGRRAAAVADRPAFRAARDRAPGLFLLRNVFHR